MTRLSRRSSASRKSARYYLISITRTNSPMISRAHKVYGNVGEARGKRRQRVLLRFRQLPPVFDSARWHQGGRRGAGRGRGWLDSPFSAISTATVAKRP